jgi:hypothetical protein
MRGEPREMPVKQGSGIRKSGRVFGQGQKAAKTIRVRRMLAMGKM